MTLMRIELDSHNFRQKNPYYLSDCLFSFTS
jgi:hypothetical protein